MTTRTAPLRWLLALVVVTFLTGLYVMWLVSSRREEWQVPPQINSVVLTLCSVVLVIAGVVVVVVPVIRGALAGVLAAIVQAQAALRVLVEEHDAGVREALDRRDAEGADIARSMALYVARDEPTRPLTRSSGVYRATAPVTAIDEATTLREIESEMKGWIARDLDDPDGEMRT